MEQRQVAIRSPKVGLNIAFGYSVGFWHLKVLENKDKKKLSALDR